MDEPIHINLGIESRVALSNRLTVKAFGLVPFAKQVLIAGIFKGVGIGFHGLFCQQQKASFMVKRVVELFVPNFPTADAVVGHVHVFGVGAVLHPHDFADVGAGGEGVGDGVGVQQAHRVAPFAQFNGCGDAHDAAADEEEVVAFHVVNVVSRLKESFEINLEKKTNRFIFASRFNFIMSKSAKTRQFIIEKSAAIFNQKGYTGTSMSDIMEATGLSKGGIYGNFKREGLDKNGVKDEIAIAAFEHAVQKVYDAIKERTAVIEHTLDKLKAVVYFYRERILDPPVEGGCPIQNNAVESDNMLPVLHEKVQGALAEWERRIVRTLEKGIENGEVRADVNKAEFATLFIGTLEGGILLARVQKSVKPFEVMARQLVSMIESLRP